MLPSNVCDIPAIISRIDAEIGSTDANPKIYDNSTFVAVNIFFLFGTFAWQKEA